MEGKTVEGKSYSSIEAAEADMRESLPKVLYKYRDWNIDFHKKCLLVPEIYYSHPKSLNDPYDIRVPVKVDYGDVDSPEFFKKIEETIKYAHPELITDSYAFQVASSNLHDLIKRNPKAWFEQNLKSIRESNLYDSIGVFSLTLDATNETMWAYYSNDHKGFCIGYDPVEVYKAHPCSCTYVRYTNEPQKKSLLDTTNRDSLFEDFYLKQKKWQHEKEYRFVTMYMAREKDRIINIPKHAIKQVVLGRSISRDHEKEIKNILKQDYQSNVELFRLEESVSDYGFNLIKVNY
jgi:hypothetical protein